MKLAIYGQGRFGNGLTHYFTRLLKDDFWSKIHVGDVRPEVCSSIKENQSNPYHFSDFGFVKKVKVNKSKKSLLKGADYVVVAVSSDAVRETLSDFYKYLTQPANVIMVSKGLERDTNKFLTEVAKEELAKSEHKHGIAYFCGGTTADDVLLGLPLCAEVTSEDSKVLEDVAKFMHSSVIRVYPNTDYKGVQTSAALKNVISIGKGAMEQAGYDSRQIAGFVAGGGNDIYRIAMELGADEQTFLPGSMASWGDWILSWYGNTRNREYGKRIIALADRDRALETMISEKGSVEGHEATETTYHLAKELGVDTPYVDMVYQMLYEGGNPNELIQEFVKGERKRARNRMIKLSGDERDTMRMINELKDSLLFGVGICRGMGYDVGAVAPLLSRAATDLNKAGVALGARNELFLPGTSLFWEEILAKAFDHNKAIEYGIRIGKGADPEVALAVMGKINNYHTIAEMYQLGQNLKAEDPNLEMSTVDEIYHIVHEGKTPQDAMRDLMNREQKRIEKVRWRDSWKKGFEHIKKSKYFSRFFTSR